MPQDRRTVIRGQRCREAAGAKGDACAKTVRGNKIARTCRCSSSAEAQCRDSQSRERLPAGSTSSVSALSALAGRMAARKWMRRHTSGCDMMTAQRLHVRAMAVILRHRHFNKLVWCGVLAMGALDLPVCLHQRAAACMHRVPPVGLVDEQEHCDQQVFAESADVTWRYFCCHRRCHAGEGCTPPQLPFARFAEQVLKLMCFVL